LELLAVLVDPMEPQRRPQIQKQIQNLILLHQPRSMRVVLGPDLLVVLEDSVVDGPLLLELDLGVAIEDDRDEQVHEHQDHHHIERVKEEVGLEGVAAADGFIVVVDEVLVGGVLDALVQDAPRLKE